MRRVATQVQNSRLVEEVRTKIIKAAIQVFRKKGYHLATTKDLALAAGVTQSNLYNYISTKDDILYMVCERLVALYSNAVDEASEKFADPHAQLLASLRAIVALMNSHREEVLLLYNDAHSLAKDDRRLILSMISRFIDKFENLVRNYESSYGPIRVGNRRLAANLLSFVPAMLALRQWDLAADMRKANLEDEIVSFLLAGIGVDTQAPPRIEEPAPA